MTEKLNADRFYWYGSLLVSVQDVREIINRAAQFEYGNWELEIYETKNLAVDWGACCELRVTHRFVDGEWVIYNPDVDDAIEKLTAERQRLEDEWENSPEKWILGPKPVQPNKF